MEIVDYFQKGDPYPPRDNKSVLRLYSVPVSPNSERVRLVLVAKGIEHEIINVNLGDKPEWLWERNPKGSVPVMEFDSDDKVITESLIISQYLDEVFAGRKLQSNDPYIRAKDLEFIERVSPHLGVYARAVWTKEDKSIVWTGIQESLKKVEELMANQRTQKFLSGDSEPGFVDYMIWPFIERFPIAIDMTSDDVKSDEYLCNELPTIDGLRNEMLSDSTVKKVCLSFDDLFEYCIETHNNFLQN